MNQAAFPMRVRPPQIERRTFGVRWSSAEASMPSSRSFRSSYIFFVNGF
jgi:hypothetical protein